MSRIEPVDPLREHGLTGRIRDFWSRNVNAERIMGREVSAHRRGSDGYFEDLAAQRYRSHRHLRPWIDSIPRGHSVLEVGCGIGLDSYIMAGRGLELYSVDLTEVGVRTASERLFRHNLAARFSVADACHLPFPEDSFDCYYSFGVLHHVAHTATAIAEAHRVLRPGGEALIMLYHRRSLNEAIHRLTGVPFEDRDELCPVVRRFTVAEVQSLFHAFSSVRIQQEYAFGEGYGPIFRYIPTWAYSWLSRRFGWHLMIRASK